MNVCEQDANNADPLCQPRQKLGVVDKFGLISEVNCGGIKNNVADQQRSFFTSEVVTLVVRTIVSFYHLLAMLLDHWMV